MTEQDLKIGNKYEEPGLGIIVEIKGFDQDGDVVLEQISGQHFFNPYSAYSEEIDPACKEGYVGIFKSQFLQDWIQYFED